MSTTNTDAIEACTGYKTLKEDVERDCYNDEKHGRAHFHDYRGKLAWVLARAKHYADKTGIKAADILDAWEKDRTYWYMNYYQDGNQPLIEGARVRVFETKEDLQEAIGKSAFRCPACAGVSKDPYDCDSGIIKGKENKPCDWKVYGLFRDLGKGVYVFVKAEMRGQLIFKPIAWEDAQP